MLFNSINFLLFFPIVFFLYFLFPKKYRYLWLLVASYYFYMNWNAKYALLLLFSTVVTYITGLLIGTKKKYSKCWLILCVVCNLLILAVYKYADFVIFNINRVLSSVNIEFNIPEFDLLLPVGISFYTFQALSYAIDVYRGKIEPERNLARYALFVSFFPQLVAGPIERSENLLSQLQKGSDFDYQNAKNGLMLMLWGFFEKILIADRLGVLVDAIFLDENKWSGAMLLLAIFMFAIQIYCDFSGYSHIAIGTAQTLGYDLMDNFKQPYFAVSIKDFWRRWHISLSGWFRDYLYIPLGGNRGSKGKTYFNLFITFLMSGLWHGASWNFIIWGGIHGVYQVIGAMTGKIRHHIMERMNINTEGIAYGIWQRVVTFLLVSFAWLFFRAESMQMSLRVMRRIVTQFELHEMKRQLYEQLAVTNIEILVLVICILVLFTVDFLHEKGICIRSVVGRMNIVLRWGIYLTTTAVLVVGALYTYGADAANFIYFQF